MKNLFALIGLLVVGLAGAGWYLGWYKINVSKNPDGKLQIQTNVDTQKVSGDSSAFFQKVGQLVSDKVPPAGPTGTPPSATPASTPGTTTSTTTQPGTPAIPNLPSIAPPGNGLNNLIPNVPVLNQP